MATKGLIEDPRLRISLSSMLQSQRGRFANRSAALRAGLDTVLREERERVIDDAYRLGYGKHPQEDWIGEAGLALFAASAKAEASDLN